MLKAKVFCFCSLVDWVGRESHAATQTNLHTHTHNTHTVEPRLLLSPAEGPSAPCSWV